MGVSSTKLYVDANGKASLVKELDARVVVRRAGRDIERTHSARLCQDFI